MLFGDFMFDSFAIVIVALLFSAFFSGMEIAFTSSNKLKLEIERKGNRVFSYITGLFYKHPGQYITSILVGNNIALVVYSLNMTLLLSALAANYGIRLGEGAVFVETLISTVIIIFTAEFTPKAIVKLNPNFYLRAFAVPVYVFYLLIYPVARATTWLAGAMLRVLGFRLDRTLRIGGFDKVDLANLVEEAAESEFSQDNEIRLFQNALDFSDLSVRDCMVPRIDMEAVDVATPIGELVERFVETKYSRIFIYDGSIDNIIGYVTTKSMFTLPGDIRRVLIPVGYVPESMPAQKVLNGFIKRKQSVAVVIDEFGGTAGMVSLEDVLEEIFGEIEDEHDSQDMVDKKVGEGEYILSCRLEIDYLNEKYGLDISRSDEYDTLAGYIIYNYEGIPAQGGRLVIADHEIRVLKAKGSKLELVRLKVIR